MAFLQCNAAVIEEEDLYALTHSAFAAGGPVTSPSDECIASGCIFGHTALCGEGQEGDTDGLMFFKQTLII